MASSLFRPHRIAHAIGGVFLMNSFGSTSIYRIMLGFDCALANVNISGCPRSPEFRSIRLQSMESNRTALVKDRSIYSRTGVSMRPAVAAIWPSNQSGEFDKQRIW